jgi:histidinol-phosphate phosphatase family protein
MVEREISGKKAVLGDRDDTLVKDVVYCSDPEKLQLLPGVPKAIAKLNKAGYIVIVVTNQSGIARGLLDESILASIHEKMIREIEAGGGHITDIFYCPHHPDDRCTCRKPETDLGVAAIMKYNINPRESYMIGDHEKDIEFGKRLGLKTYQVSEKRTFVKIVDEIITDDKI